MQLLGLIAFLWILGTALIWPLLPFQALAFGATPLLVTLLFATDTAVAMVCAPTFGRISDKLGRRPAIVAGLIFGAVSLLYFAIADSLFDLFLSRALGGLSIAALPALQAALSDITSRERRIFGFSTFHGAYASAFVVGPLLTWQALELFGLSAGWIGLLAAAIATAACGLSLLHGEAARAVETSTAAASSGPTPSGPATDGGWRGLMVPALLVPLAAIFLLSLAHAGWDAILAVWADAALRWGEAEVAIGYAVAGSCAAATQFLVAPRLCERIGEGNCARLAALLAAGALLVLAIGRDGVVCLIALGLLGAAMASASSCLFSLLTQAAPADRQGIALGLAGSVFNLAWLLGPIAAGLGFFATWPGLPFLLGTAACLLGLAALAIPVAVRALRPGAALSEW